MVRAAGRVSCADRFEKGAARWHNSLGLVVDRKAILPVHDVAEDDAWMTMRRARTRAKVSLEEDDLESFERSVQRMSRHR